MFGAFGHMNVLRDNERIDDDIWPEGGSMMISLCMNVSRSHTLWFSVYTVCSPAPRKQHNYNGAIKTREEARSRLTSGWRGAARLVESASDCSNPPAS